MATKMTSAAFLKKLLRVASEHPEFAGKFAITAVKQERASKTRAKSVTRGAAKQRRCVRYGIDPVTGEKICIEWVTT